MTRYSQEQIMRIWLQTTRPLDGLLRNMHPSDAALDQHGQVICLSKYGDAESKYGWEVDHRYPSALGGSDVHANLRALNCSSNRSLGGLLGSALRRRF